MTTMDEETRRMLKEAFAQDDAARADLQQAQRAACEDVKRKNFDADLVYRVNENARIDPLQAATMPAEFQKQWDAWADGRIRGAIDENTDLLIDATTEYVREFAINPLKVEIAMLRSEVAGLRAKLEQQRGKITQLRGDVPWSRADAA